MTAFFALLRLQLLSRYSDLKPKNWKTLDPKRKKRTILNVVLYAFLLVYLGGVMFYLETKAIDLLMKMGTPPYGLADLIVTAATAVSIIGTLILAFFFVMSSLYLSRDSVFLAALPLKPRTILAAKLVQIWISETAINALILLPACILYGIRTAQPPLFFVRLLFVWLAAPMMPICVGALLATLLVRASALLRHREAIMTVGGMVLMVGYIYFSMSFGGMMGNTGSGGDMLQSFLMSNQSRIEGFTKIFPPAGWAVRGLMGDWSQLVLFVAASLASFVLLVAVLGIWYRKLSLIQAEAPVAVSGKKGIQRGAFSNTGNALSALVKREILQIIRVPSYATNILPVCLMPPLMVVLMGLYLGKNIGSNGESLEILFQQIPGALTVGAIAAFVCFMGDMNPALSTAVSREGRGHSFMLGLPVSVRTHLNSKLIVGYGLSALGIVITGVALAFLFPLARLESILACVLALLFTFITSCLALAKDVKNPRLNWVTEQEAVKQNFGTMISMLIGLAMLAALGTLSWLLIDKLHVVAPLPYFGIIAALLAAGCAAAYVHLMKAGERYYIRQ